MSKASIANPNQQKVQVAVLGVLAVGMFGLFAYRLIKPTPAAAHQQTAAAQATKGLLEASIAPIVDSALAAPAPTPGMRDPFIAKVIDPKAIDAYNQSSKTAPADQGNSTPPSSQPDHVSQKSSGSNKVAVPSAPPIPGLGTTNDAPPPDVAPPTAPALTTAPMPPAPAPTAPQPSPDDSAGPAWVVTGVIGGDAGQVAVLRNGDSRRIVREGDMVDNQYKVVSISSSQVRLRRGVLIYVIGLGATTASVVTPINWLSDLQSAKAQALKTGEPLLIFFHASWCGPCHVMEDSTFYDASVTAVMNKMVCVKLDVDQDKQDAASFGINAVPRIVVFPSAGGNRVMDMLGYHDVPTFLTTLSGALHIKTPMPRDAGGAVPGSDVRPRTASLEGADATGSNSGGGAIAWRSDLDAVQNEAKTSGKLIFIDFYTDWCHWCKKLDTDVYPDQAVQQAMSRYIPVRLNAEQEGKDLAARFNVKGYPTLIICDGTLHEINRTYFEDAPTLARRLDSAAEGRVAAAPGTED